MKVNVQINTDRCTQTDSTAINVIVAEAIDAAMGEVWNKMGIPSRRVVSVGESFDIIFNLGPG